VGSLDELMQLMDSFAKLDVAIDSSCRRNERLYFDLAKELEKKGNLVIEIPGQRDSQNLEVEAYIN